MIDTPKLTDCVKPMQAVGEELGIRGIQRDIDDLTTKTRWLRQDAERVPWRFSDEMLADINGFMIELNVAILLVEEYRARKGGRPRKARGAATSSDASDSRWTVRGIPPNVRAMAVKAASERGTTLGDTLCLAIQVLLNCPPKRRAND